MSSAIEKIDGVRTVLWVWTWLLFFYLLLWFWWGITASTYRYELAQNTGILTNERWNTDFVLTASLLFQLIIPFTLAYSLDQPLRTWRRTMHVVFLMIFFVYGIITMSFWAVDYNHANEATASNARNPANDPRWCNLYYAIPGSGCYQTSPTPGLVASMLTVSSVFLWKFWFLIIWLILLIITFTVIMVAYREVVNAYMDENDPLLPDEEKNQDSDARPTTTSTSQKQTVTFNAPVSSKLRYYGSMLGRKL